MKRITSLTLLITLVFTIFISIPVLSQDEITVFVNGKRMVFENAQPIIQNGRTLVPMRAIFEALDVEVEWDGETKTISATKDSLNVTMQIDNSSMSVNGDVVSLETAPQIINDSTMIPVRAVADVFGADVQWSDERKFISITTNGIPVYADCPDVPDMGKILNVEPKDVIINDGYVQYTYIIEEIVDLPNLSSIDESYSEAGYALVTEPEDLETYYDKSNTLVYVNPNNNNFIIRALAVVDSDEENVWLVEVSDAIKAYDRFGNEQYIDYVEKDAWEKLGWYTEDKCVTLYSDDGETITVPEDYLVYTMASGEWHSDINDVQATLYAEDGRTIVVLRKDIPAYLSVGWYENIEDVQRTMLSEDGQTKVVYRSEIADYVNAGWREILTNPDEIEKYLEEKYSDFTTSLGETSFSFSVRGNDSSLVAYDYSINMTFDYQFFHDIEYSINYSAEEKAAAKGELKWYQEQIARDLISKLPGKKLEGGYHYGWYKYESIREGYTSVSSYMWSNYERTFSGNIGSAYYDSYVTEFHWTNEQFI